MALRMVSRFYLTYPDAVQAMADLTQAGFSEGDLSLIESEDDARLPAGVAADSAQSPAATGATIGGGMGGGVGVLVGIGAIPFALAAPVVALGWLAPTAIGVVIGVALGMVIGRVTRPGVGRRQSHIFAAGLQRGEPLVMVQVEEGRVPEIEAILARTHLPMPPVEERDRFEAALTAEPLSREAERVQ